MAHFLNLSLSLSISSSAVLWELLLAVGKCTNSGNSLEHLIPNNNDLNQLCGIKEIKRDSSVPRTRQQNRIAERKNRTLIEAARSMLVDSLLPIPFWAEAVNTACYVQNRVLVTKPQNKTPYELLLGRTPSIGFMRPFGYLMTILNTLDPFGKFDGKVDEGFLVGYSISSKAFRVFNSRTRIVQETLYINFLESKLSFTGSGPTWLFDIDTLIKTMNYQPVTAGNQSNPSACVQEQFDAEKAGEENVQQYVLFPVWSSGSKNPQNTDGDAAFEVKEPEFKGRKPESEVRVSPSNFEDFFDNSINEVNAADSLVPVVGKISTNSTNTFSTAGPSNTAVSLTHGKSSYVNTYQYLDDPNMPELEDITYSNDEEDVGAEADFTNLETTITEEGIDYEEVFDPVARIEAIRLFLAYASFMGFMVYQMDVKSAFLYGTIEEEVYVCQPPGFEDPDYPDKVYKVVKALYGLYQAHRAWYETLANYLLENGFQKGKIDQTLFIKRQKGDILLVQIYVDDIIFVKQKPDRIFISQDKYVAKILRKFDLTDRKSASTPIDTEKPLLKDPDGEDVDVHTYRSMIGSLMYLTSSRPDIMFTVYASYSDSDYAGVSLDKKSTTGGCQFLGCRLISWQCKKQIVVATSSAEAEYVAAASCCAQVLWIQNQLLDYGYDEDRLDLMELAFFVVNDVIRLQALVDRKKVIIIEATVREALRLDDVESIDCLPNEEIFTELSRMGAQVGNLSSHTTKYSSPSLTQKVFANMRRVGKGFSGVETPLFEGMIVAQQVDDVDDVADESVAGVDVDDVPAAATEPSIPSPTPNTQPSPPPQELPSTSQVIPTPPPSPIPQPSSPPQQQQPTHDAEILMDLLQTLLETCSATSVIRVVATVMVAVAVVTTYVISLVVVTTSTTSLSLAGSNPYHPACSRPCQHVLVDRKKVIIIEATVREALRLDDVESIDCLPNEEIFTELSRMGYEKPS
nr:putative ribonuclease H-like domain-containing protein [Tanacetum cinerariifolium]